tara:strand:- start:613 stop:750 length:138 start_codon:yes stop_codon:yes gene_type:complete
MTENKIKKNKSNIDKNNAKITRLKRLEKELKLNILKRKLAKKNNG